MPGLKKSLALNTLKYSSVFVTFNLVANPLCQFENGCGRKNWIIDARISAGEFSCNQTVHIGCAGYMAYFLAGRTLFFTVNFKCNAAA
jgi:hypothetical protein